MGLFFGHNQISGFGNDFVFTIDTTKGTGDSFILPLRSGFTYDFIVDWGDNSSSEITAYDDADITHNYASGGVYQLRIRGTCEAWYFNNVGDRLKFISIDNWGSPGFKENGLSNGFRGCSNLEILPQLPMPYISVTSLVGTFWSCIKLTGNAIPSNLLYLLTELTSLQQCFQAVNMNLHEEFIKYNTKLTNVSFMHYAVNLTDKYIPEDYFYHNKLITNYSYVFAEARNMILPSRMFDTSVLNIVTTFRNFMAADNELYSNTGTIQDVWNYATGAISINAFIRQTALTNYASIPNSWKGL